jgi:two-component system, NtrC family, sensor histidine kinase KinB
MQESRLLAGPTTDIVGLQRSRVLNSCLLIIGLMMGASAGTNVVVQLGQGDLDLSVSRAVLLLIGAAWLIVAYVLSRRRYLRLAGAMIVTLVIAVLGLAIYALPSYTGPLLPFAALPVALAALLIGRRSIYIAAAFTILALVAAVVGNRILPARALGLESPAPSPEVSLLLAAAALAFLAFALAPLRAELARLFKQLRDGELALARAEQRRRATEGRLEAVVAQLAWQQQHTDLILQQMNDGAIAVDSGGKIIRASAAARALWAAVGGGDILDRPFEQVRAELCGSSAATEHVSIVALADEAPKGATGYTHVLLDRREQAHLAQLRGELLGLLAGEMRNPLTSMITALEMTLGQNLPEGADRVLVGARRSGQRLLDLVMTLLEIDQIEHSPEALRRTLAPLRPVLEAAIAQTAPLAQQGAVTVMVEYSGDGSVLLDGERMRRAIVYLLENALRHSPPYSTVQVRTERQNSALVVRISDQGPGFTPQECESLFDQRTPADGRGVSPLGLTFSKLAIETHGGRVWAESTESQGTTYAFTLPLEK